MRPCWVRPYITQREEKGAYHNLLAELYDFDVPGFTNFMRMTPEFFLMIKARVHPHLVRQATNYRGPLSVGMKLAITFCGHWGVIPVIIIPVYGWQVLNIKICAKSVQGYPR